MIYEIERDDLARALYILGCSTQRAVFAAVLLHVRMSLVKAPLLEGEMNTM